MQLKTGLLRLTTAVASLLSVTNALAISQDAAGVYQICTADELYEFAQIVNGSHATIAQNLAANAVLTADIEVNNNVLKSDGSLNGDGSNFKSWTPIGKAKSIPYSGSFNGKGHSISGLYFSNINADYVGLFGCIGEGGKVDSIGVLASYFYGSSYVGGVCGYQDVGTISNSYNIGNVSGKSGVGGVCGYNNNDTINNCYNTGSVNGTEKIGGVCGYVYSGTVKNSYNNGSVSGSEEVGGVCGCNIQNGTISNSYNTGSVSGSKEIGGVCGCNILDGSTINNCYNTGSVDGNEYVGGVCGFNDENGTISNCYCIDKTIVGDNGGSITNCSTKTLAQFKSGEVAYLLSQGKDGDVWGQKLGSDSIPIFSTDVVYAVKNCKEIITGYTNTKPSVELVHVGDDYVNGFCPRCDAYQPATKNSDGVYEIGNAGQLYWFASFVNDSNVAAANAILTADITVNKNVLAADGSLNSTQPDTFRVWTPIGKNESILYSGTFNGNGHTISGLYYNSSESGYVGLFGFIISEVKSVGVLDSYFKGKTYVGGVCGYNYYGTINTCYNTGSVNGSQYVGGVCGFVYDKASISNCYNTGSVNGSSEVGGVCGFAYTATVKNCYNTGSVSGSSEVGGVCGVSYDNSTVSNCYCTGDVIVGKGASSNCSTKTIALFQSGEVAYLLSLGEDGEVWGQKLGTDTIPVFSSDIVYAEKKCNNTISGYTNTKPSVEHVGDDYVNGFCPRCDAYQPATKNSDGVYEIGNAGQLYWFASLVNDSSKTSANAILTADITVNKNVLAADGSLNSTQPDTFRVWTPIGKDDTTMYSGTFNGKGCSVSGLYFNDSTVVHVGFLGYTTSESKVDSVGILASYFKGRFYVGGVCGENEGSISTCYNTGSVSGCLAVGGVCGYDYIGTISNCYNTGSINGSKAVGGVCGFTYGSISNCYSTGSVIGSDFVGGLCGLNAATDEGSSTIKNCYNMGTVSGANFVGGLCGKNYGTISNCYNTGNALASSNVGGVCGGIEQGGIVSNCYNTGSISGSESVGGVCGLRLTDCIVNNCYCTGETIVGNGTSTNCSTKTLDQFKSGEVAYLLSRGKDGDVWGQKLGTDDIPVFSTDVVYAEKEKCNDPITGYTNTKTFFEHAGDGYVNGFCPRCDAYQPATKNSAGVYEIGNAGQLYWLASLVNDSGKATSNAILTADIMVNKNVLAADGSLNSTKPDTFRVWTPIGDLSKKYTGSFNGMGYTVSGLFYNDTNSSHVGLFGSIDERGKVDSIGVLDSYFNAHDYVGGVCGIIFDNGSISNSYNAGSVNGVDFVGGVCGYNCDNCIIINCYNSGSVSGSHNTGGMCGFNAGTIRNSYNTGSVIASNDYVGGVSGFNYENGSICNSYNTGRVNGFNYVGGVLGGIFNGTVSNSYNTGYVAGNESVGEVCGLKLTDCTVSNCYCTGETIVGEDKGSTTNCSTKTLAQFKSGEVAYLLSQGEDGDVWGQNLGTDTIPVFSDDKVYLYENCLGNSAYTNDVSKNGVTGEHDFSQKVLTENANAKGLYAYVCANDASHISNYNVIKAYNGTDNLELDSTAEGEYFVESLALRDTECFNSPVDFIAKSFSYDRKPASEIVTFMLPIDVPTKSLNGNAYYLNQFDGSTLKFKGTNDIKANTPYMVRVTEKGDSLVSELNNVTVKATTSINETTVGNATHFGSYVSTKIDNDANYDYYGYSEGKFFRGKVGVSVAPFRSAIKLAKATSAVGNGKPRMSPAELNIEFDDEEATGVEITPAEIGISGKVNVYDVLGHAIRVNVEAEGCLNGLQNGVYIVNGKKVIVRE